MSDIDGKARVPVLAVLFAFGSLYPVSTPPWFPADTVPGAGGSTGHASVGPVGEWRMVSRRLTKSMGDHASAEYWTSSRHSVLRDWMADASA